MRGPEAFSNNRKLDLAGNAFNGFIVVALCTSLMACTDWQLARSARHDHEDVDGEIGEEGTGEEESEESEGADDEDNVKGSEDFSDA